MYDKILSKTNLIKRQIAMDPLCNACHAEPETSLHLLRDCKYLQKYWGMAFATVGHQPVDFF